MNDSIRKSDLQPETSPLDALIIATMITAEVARLQADPDSGDIVDALKARLPILSKSISAARMAGSILEKDTHPEVIATRAATNTAAAAAQEATRKAYSRRLELRQEVRNGEAAVEKCREGLTRAESELARLENGDASDRERVLAEGSAALWSDRLAKAQANLDTLRKAEASR